MILPPDTSKGLVKNNSVYDLKAASRRNSETVSIVTVPPSYESALSDPSHLSSASSYSLTEGSDCPSTPTPSSSVVRRHRLHWHHDAQRYSIVLHIEDLLFKVQPDILKDYAPLLADFVNHIMTPSQLPVDTVDGYKCYHIPAMSAQGTAELLNRVYHLHRTGASETHSLHSLALLIPPLLGYARKGSPSLHSKCIRTLEPFIPTDTSTLINLNRKGLLRCYGDTAFKILRVIRTAGPEGRHLLPFAFFLCARCKTADIVETPIISWEDKAYCLAGRDEISRLLRFDIYRKYTSSEAFSPQHCRSTPRCSTSTSAARTLEKHLSVELFGFFTKVDCVCCVICAKEIQHEVKQRWLRSVWDNLPTLFRLGTWESLGVRPG